VRIALAALRCEKGDVDANLAAHLAIFGAARRDGASLVVFPEMSLTGSVDPVRRRDWLVPLDAPRVEALVAATARGRVDAVGAGVVFGVAERDGDGAARITQCVALDGELVGVYRKRRLGDDEVGFVPGERPCCFDHDGTRVGVIVCADSTVDEPFDDVVACGARVVLFCAAPGLFGPRRDDAGFADGLQWWESAGLADACRHARRHGVWVALATQAGATVDEDFPGCAALVSPAGEVVARTPDWRAATLIVDMPR
jgi:predicted amidohydrolase